MINMFGKAILAAAIGLGAVATIPATASADEIMVIRDGWHRDWGARDYRRDEYRPRYEHYEGRRWGYWDRPWHHHHRPMRCFENRWGRLICER